VNEPAGQYQIQITAVGGPAANFYVWDGNASGGVPYSFNTSIPRLGTTLDLNHAAGDIVFYNHDWYAYDNDPAATITFALFAMSSGLSAPTNLQATQIGNSGTQIQLTWDYGSPIDGFRIERKTPLAADWEIVPVTLLADQRAWVENPPIPFATYVYRLTAFAGSDLSDPSNEATCFQLKLFTSLGGTAMEAIFQPGESLFGLAQKYGFGHFNWISTVTSVPSTISAPPRPFLDPPLGGYPDRPADSFPYYWDDVLGFDVRFFIGAWTQANTVRFLDAPGYPSGSPLDHMEFKTMLVGVQGPVGSSSWQSKPLASFSWNSNRIGNWGGVYDYRFSNLDSPLTSGPGGIFNPVVVRTEDLPLIVRQFFAQMGVQNISTAPKVDKDAPITAAFLSGQQGANGWYTGSVTVTLIATDIDGPADIAATSYRLDGGPVVAYTAPFTISSIGTHTIVFGSVDHALNAESPLPSQTFTITATALLAVTTASLPGGVIGAPYSQTLAATGGTPPYLWTVSAGRLPVGLTLNAATGQITGTPTNPVSSLVTFKVTDAGVPAQTTAVQLTFTILPNTLTITTSSLPKGQVGIAYSQTVATIGGTTPFTWEFAGGGALPPGLTLNTLTGQISGTPTVAVTNYRLLLRVTDSTTPTPQSAAASFTLTIAPGSSPN
jgi:hypothetical protein